MINYYRILGVSEYASDQQIRQAYRTLAKRYHPDLNPGDTRAADKFKELASAYEVLSDPILRSNYDKKRLRESLYKPGPFFAGFDNQKNKSQTTADRRAKYSESTWEWAETKRDIRDKAHRRRRKKIFVAMTISLMIFIPAAIWFDDMVRKQREEDYQNALINFANNSPGQPTGDTHEPKEINNFDSPYDTIFGNGIYDDFSPHSLTVLSPPMPAIICLVEDRAPWRTIRNEYLEPNSWFTLRDIPAGSYFFKINTGYNWNSRVMNAGIACGGFRRDNSFYISDDPATQLFSPAGTSTPVSDTLSLSPLHHNFTRVSAKEFFARELTVDPRK